MPIPAKIDLTPDVLSVIEQNSGATLDDLYIYYIPPTKYITNRENILGSGAFGHVYKAFPIADNGEVDLTAPVALKICSLQEERQKERLNIEISVLKAAQFRNVSGITYFNGEQAFAAFTMEYFDAKPLNHPDSIKMLENLTLAERVDLIRQGALFLSLIHSERSKYSAFFLTDIKPENVLLGVKIINGKKVYFLIPIDFDLASKLEGRNLQKTEKTRGTITTVAPELYEGNCGPKSDVYSFVSIVLMLLNVANPSILIDENYSLRCDYSMTGFLDELTISNMDLKTQRILKTLIAKFVFRMREKEYHARAETNEVLTFFIYLQQVCLLYKKLESINTLKDQLDFDLRSFDVSLLKNLFADQITPSVIETVNSLTQAQYELIGRFTLDKLKILLSIPNDKLASCWKMVKSLHNPSLAKNLSEAQKHKTALKKLTPTQCQILDELDPEDGKIIETFSRTQKETLNTLSSRQFQLLKNFNLTTLNDHSKTITLSLPNKLILQEILQNTPADFVTGLGHEDILKELNKLQNEAEQQITILLTKLSVLTAATNNVQVEDADEARLRLCQQYSFQDNPDISALISFLMLLDAENYNIDYGNYDAVKNALALSKQTNCLTLFLLQCLCDNGKENDLVLAMIRLNIIDCLTVQFVKLFKDKNNFSLQVAKAINEANHDVIIKNKQELTNLLDEVLLSENSPSTFFTATPTPVEIKGKILELLGVYPTSPSKTLDPNPIASLDVQSPTMAK